MNEVLKCISWKIQRDNPRQGIKKTPLGAFKKEHYFCFLYLLISSCSCLLIFCSLSKARRL